MKNYSLVEAVYSRADPMDLVDPSIRLHEMADRFWESGYPIHELDQYCSLMCEGDLLLEFSLKDFIKDNLVNVLQAGIGWALEAGITVGSLGVGAPAAVAAEFMNDAVFFGFSAGDALTSIKNVFSDLGEMKDAVQAMLSINIDNTPQEIYNTVQNLINKLGAFFKKIGLKVKEGIEKLKDLYRKLMVKIAKVAGDTIAMFVPVPGVDAIIQNGIAEFADDAFKLMVKMYDKIPEFLKEYIQDPTKMKDTLLGAADAVIGFIEKFYGAAKRKKQSLWKKLKSTVTDVAILGPVGTLLKKSGAAQKIIDWLKGKAKGAIEFCVSAVQKIIPVLWGAGSALTILVNDDHDLFKDEGEGGDDASAGTDKKPAAKKEKKEEKAAASNESYLQHKMIISGKIRYGQISD